MLSIKFAAWFIRFMSLFFSELQLLHENIDVIERKSSSNISGGTIIIKCKDFRIILVDIKSSEDFNNVALSLERLSSLGE